LCPSNGSEICPVLADNMNEAKKYSKKKDKILDFW